jgi:hypothetical protein
VPKHRGIVLLSNLQDGRIQWLVERFHANPNIIVEYLHHQQKEVFLLFFGTN